MLWCTHYCTTKMCNVFIHNTTLWSTIWVFCCETIVNATINKHIVTNHLSHEWYPPTSSKCSLGTMNTLRRLFFATERYLCMYTRRVGLLYQQNKQDKRYPTCQSVASRYLGPTFRWTSVRMNTFTSLEFATHVDPAAKLYNKWTSRTNCAKGGREDAAWHTCGHCRNHEPLCASFNPS